MKIHENWIVPLDAIKCHDKFVFDHLVINRSHLVILEPTVRLSLDQFVYRRKKTTQRSFIHTTDWFCSNDIFDDNTRFHTQWVIQVPTFGFVYVIFWCSLFGNWLKHSFIVLQVSHLVPAYWTISINCASVTLFSAFCLCCYCPLLLFQLSCATKMTSNNHLLLRLSNKPTNVWSSAHQWNFLLKKNKLRHEYTIFN